MGLKRSVFKKTLFIHNLVAKRAGCYVDIIPNDYVIARSMLYDKFSKQYVSKESRDSDYVRYRALELVSEEIENNNIKGCCAEAGVFLGEFSGEINRCFPDRRLYLYDTFEGFDSRDLKEQMDRFNMKDLPLSKGVMDTAEKYSADEQIKIVRSRLVTPENVIIRQGYFPDTATDEEELRFAFVSLDMDYYRPLLEGLKFFWPRMNDGGYIFMHDYNCHDELTGGAHKAAVDAQDYFNTRFHILPLPDYAGTLAIVK